MKTRDFPVVLEAKRVAIAQLAYYRKMMEIKNENQAKREATTQSVRRSVPTA